MFVLKIKDTKTHFPFCYLYAGGPVLFLSENKINNESQFQVTFFNYEKKPNQPNKQKVNQNLTTPPKNPKPKQQQQNPTNKQMKKQPSDILHYVSSYC